MSSGPRRRQGARGGRREHRVETRNSREPPVPHTPEQGQPSPRTARARVSAAGESSHQGSKLSWTGPRLPRRLPAWALGTAPAPVPQSFSRPVSAGSHARRGLAGSAGPPPGEQPGARQCVRVHLIFFSIFTASSWLDVRVGQVCQREAGDAGGRDGEPGVRHRVGPALLRAPGRRRRKVL